jgi:hypothetical protein
MSTATPLRGLQSRLESTTSMERFSGTPDWWLVPLLLARTLERCSIVLTQYGPSVSSGVRRAQLAAAIAGGVLPTTPARAGVTR